MYRVSGDYVMTAYTVRSIISNFLYDELTNAQLVNNLLYCSLLHYRYMFRRYCVIFKDLAVSTC